MGCQVTFRIKTDIQCPALIIRCRAVTRKFPVCIYNLICSLDIKCDGSDIRSSDQFDKSLNGISCTEIITYIRLNILTAV